MFTKIASKELVEDLTGKDIPRIMGLLVQDSLEEAQSMDGLDYKHELEDEWKKVNKALSKDARELVLGWFKENIL